MARCKRSPFVKARCTGRRRDGADRSAPLSGATASSRGRQGARRSAARQYQADLERYSKLVVKEYATRLNVDTQEALAAQYQAAIAHDQAVIDNARVQLGYTTIVSPLAGRTGIRLIDQGNIVHASDSGGLVVVTQ